jgi:hypothetical protein
LLKSNIPHKISQKSFLFNEFPKNKTSNDFCNLCDTHILDFLGSEKLLHT